MESGNNYKPALNLEIKILFQNHHLIAVYKDHGVLSVPSRMGVKDPRNVLGIELEKKLETKIFPVHRLDFEVAGLMLFALNPTAHKILSQCFESHHKITKKYWALCTRKSDLEIEEKNLDLPSTTFEHLIASGKKRSFFAAHGKKSITSIERMKDIPFFKHRINNIQEPLFYFDVSPHTGRRHQIRLVLSSLGYPIVGDRLYGSGAFYKENAIGLIAHEIVFHDKKTMDQLELNEQKIHL